MRSRITKLRQWFNEGFWSVTSIPSLGTLSGGSNVFSALAQMNSQKDAMKGTLVTTCDVARSLCKPVDDLAGRTRAYGGYPTYSTFSRPPLPVTQYAMDMSDKGALMQAAKMVSAPGEALIAEAKEIASGM